MRSEAQQDAEHAGVEWEVTHSVSATLEEVRKHGQVLTPGCYVGAEAQVDDGELFEEKVQRLAAQLREQLKEAACLAGRQAKLDAATCLRSFGAGRSLPACRSGRPT